MDEALKSRMEDALWVAHSLFDRGKTTGSTANISFRYNGCIFISRTGSCFGRLTEQDFAVLKEKEGKAVTVSENRPSKEFPLHWMIYRNDPEVNAVIHTHSFYSVLWSCLKHENPDDVVPAYTPYLRMKAGKVKLVGYGEPGSPELFQAFSTRLETGGTYLLQNHGSVVTGKTMMEAFAKCEELEESIKVAWYLRNEPQDAVHRLPLK
ncbi:class II aldolase/adducin family protein [Clostridium vitabionis]|uniref:class II aldolase/adducin family protein n=1 Tax=Clostridium vitabionis TaxID=2784388 RepID=UPI00188BF8CC|nr:class II aldolase/adducin family protein [Clostridium vitabionis]